MIVKINPLWIRKVKRLKKIWCAITALICLSSFAHAQEKLSICFDFYGDTVRLSSCSWKPILFDKELNDKNVSTFYYEFLKNDWMAVVDSMLVYKESKEMNDWVYYQLIRKTAQILSPKAKNYERYTLYKWFFLMQSGYETRLLLLEKNKILFYVHSDENVYDIPTFTLDNKQFVCLNYHDYGKIDFSQALKDGEIVSMKKGTRTFSYKVSQLPDFTPEYVEEKKLSFKYKNKSYNFKIELNPQVDTIFKNYPVVDFESYFNIPLSKKTYTSLIPKLKEELANKTEIKGVDYLMEFTRNAFLYEDDNDNFGKEKRLSPEQTLFNKYSDCDDRVALFFYLVKEIYNRPMIVLLYPTHVTIAVNFEENIGKPVYYNNMAFTICEPTPQEENLKMGELAHKYRNQEYTVAYAYTP